MRRARKVSIAAVLASAAITAAACSSTATVQAVRTPVSTAAATTAPAAVYTPPPNPLSCSTDVGNAADGSNLTAFQVITGLEVMLIIDGTANLPAGNPSTDDISILESGQQSLLNYTSGPLAADAYQFVQDEESYGPGGNDDTSYAKALAGGILTLAHDCHTEKAALKAAG
jgi:hypothetical protein